MKAGVVWDTRDYHTGLFSPARYIHLHLSLFHDFSPAPPPGPPWWISKSYMKLDDAAPRAVFIGVQNVVS